MVSERSFRSFQLLKKNVEINNVDAECYNESFESIVSRYHFDFIDVDPYGSVVPYVDIALNHIKNKGYIGFTATDLSVLTGSIAEKNLRRYETQIPNNHLRHELGIRNLLGFIARRASVLDCGMYPVVSLWKGHYYRIIVKIIKSVEAASESISNVGKVNLFELKDIIYPDQKIGLLWLGNLCPFLSENSFVYPQSINKETVTILDSLRYEDMEFLFTDLSESFSRRKINLPSMEKIKEVAEKNSIGMQRTHFSPTGFKSDDPRELLRLILESASLEHS